MAKGIDRQDDRGFESRPVGNGGHGDQFGGVRRLAAQLGNVCPATILLHPEGKFCWDYMPPCGNVNGFCMAGRCRNAEVLAERQKFDSEGAAS